MSEPTNAEIRAWARAQGLTVSDRGRIPAAVTAAYADAHPAATAVARATSPAPPAVPAPSGDPFAPPAATGPRPVPPPFGAIPPPPPREGGTDGFAITSLVLGLLGGVLLSVVFGVLSLRRIRRTGRDGRGLAIAGLVLSAVWTLAIGAVVASEIAGQAERDETGAVTLSGDVSTDDLEIRDCTGELPDDGELRTVRVVPCDEEHFGEVYAAFPLDGQEFPGEKQVLRFAEGGCSRELELLLEDDPTPYELVYLYPTSETWAMGDRAVTCLLLAEGGAPLVGSVVDGARRGA